jgi:peptide/nickel transport system ATP-binding protein
MGDLLDIQNLSVFFRQNKKSVCALDNLCLTIRSNETMAIVGESGSGKTITALAIMGLLPKQTIVKGKIIFSPNKEQEINILDAFKKNLSEIKGKKISMIFQEPMTALNPLMTCGKQLTDVISQHLGLNKTSSQKKAIELFEKVELPFPKEIFKKYPHQISGGQRQRVMIAMAISCNPHLLIADEPTTALDTKVQHDILLLLKKLQQENQMSILLITHDLGMVSGFADDVIIMRSGIVVENGTVKKVFNNPQHDYTRNLLECRIAIKQKKLPDSSENTAATIAPVLAANNLTVEYSVERNFWGKVKSVRKAVDDLSFSVFNNEILGIVGESGCGKSTLAKCVVGLIQPNKGEINFKGKQITKNHTCNQKIQMVFQDPYSSLHPKMTIEDALQEAMKVNNIGKNQQERADKSADLLSMVGLPVDFLKKYSHEFSGGQRQRIVLARALAVDPEFLVFDESISALDAPIQQQILELIQKLKSKLNFSAIFISHDLAAVHQISDRILVMKEGKSIEMDSADSIIFQAKDKYTQSLIDALPGQHLPY